LRWPRGLTGGLVGTANPNSIIVTAGLAEIAAGSIAMGLGGYLAAKSDAEHYAKEREREKREVAEIPHEEMREVSGGVSGIWSNSGNKPGPSSRRCASSQRSGSIS